MTPEDLDWSPRSRYLQARGQARGQFARMDKNGNGRVTLEEWNNAFAAVAKGKKYVNVDEFADLLYPVAPRPPKGQTPPSMQGPSRWTLLKGLFSGEIGSASEGPRVGDKAPDFELATHDKARRIRLSGSTGKRPVVLIFGSFT